MSLSYLTEAFKSLEILEEEDFNLADKQDIEKLQDFENDQPEDVIEIMSMDFDDLEDTEVEEEEESHIGDVILDCPVCHSKLYKNSDEVIIDEDEQLANVGEECPYCYTADGFKIVGQVAPYQPEDEVTVDVEDKVEDSDDEIEEDEKEEVEESLNESKEVDLTEYQKWVDYDMKKYHKISKNTMAKIKSAGLSVVKDQYGDYEVIAKRADSDVNESFNQKLTEKRIKESKLTEMNRDIIPSDRVKVTKKILYDYLSSLDLEELDILSNNTCSNENEFIDLFKKSGDELYIPKGTTLKFVSAKGPYMYFEVNNSGKQIGILYDYFEDENLIRSLQLLEESKLTEKNWNYTLKSGSLLRDAINEGDLQQVQSSLIDCYDELHNQDLIDDDDYESYVEDVRMLDASDEDAEDEFDYQLNEFYDLCDNLNVWVALSESFNTKRKRVTEDFDKVEVETEDQKITVKSEPKEVESDNQMIAPIEPELKADIEDNTLEAEEKTEAGPEEEVEFDVDDFDEESFDEIGESYLRKVYENVTSYKTKKVSSAGNKLVVEGLITFKSKKTKPTSFIFEAKDATKKGSLRFIGENLQISRGHKSFMLKGNLNEGKFLSESLNYNYRTKDQAGKTTRVYGTARTSKR